MTRVFVYPADDGLCYNLPVPSLTERFWAKVDRAGPDDCWLWTGAATVQAPRGYGRFYPTGNQGVLAHRYAYELEVGPIPGGLQLDHLCRQRLCVNPRHLEAVEPRLNVLRGVGPTAANARKTACIKGHELRTMPNGSRACPTCAAEAKRQSQRKREGDPEWRERRRLLARERFAERMATDPAFRAYRAALSRAKHARKRSAGE